MKTNKTKGPGTNENNLTADENCVVGIAVEHVFTCLRRDGTGDYTNNGDIPDITLTPREMISLVYAGTKINTLLG